MSDEDEVFTVKEVAVKLKLKEKFVRLEIRRGRLGAMSMGGEYRISREDLEKYKRSTHTSQKKDLATVA